MSESEDLPRDAYPVGYGKPPVHSRFRKGRSGNPSGKARGSGPERAKSLILQEVYRMLRVRDGGKLKRIPALRAVVRRLVAAAAQGDLTAQRALLKNILEIEAEHRAEERATRQVNLNQLTDEQLNRICRGEE